MSRKKFLDKAEKLEKNLEVRLTTSFDDILYAKELAEKVLNNLIEYFEK